MESNRLSLGAVLLRCALLEASPRETQSTLARKLSVSQQVVSKWLRGTCLPTVAVMVVLEDEYGIPIRTWLEPFQACASQLRERAVSATSRACLEVA